MWNSVESEKMPFVPYSQGTSKIKRILDQKTIGSKRFTGFGLLEIPPNGAFPQHTHPEREEIYYVLSGSGTLLVGDEKIPANKGLTLYVHGETPHGITNETNDTLTVLYVHVRVD